MDLERRRQHRRKQSRSLDDERGQVRFGHPGRRRGDRGEPAERDPFQMLLPCRRCGALAAASFCADCEQALAW